MTFTFMELSANYINLINVDIILIYPLRRTLAYLLLLLLLGSSEDPPVKLGLQLVRIRNYRIKYISLLSQDIDNDTKRVQKSFIASTGKGKESLISKGNAHSWRFLGDECRYVDYVNIR